jgi:glucosamine-6-phosphate deaminase
VAELRVFADADELGRALAAEVAGAYDETDGPFLLGCPGGRSLRTTYAALEPRRLDRLVAVLMDEYVPVPPRGAHWSCARFAREEIGAPETWLPDPDEPDAYEQRIAAAGGIDLFLLAAGASDGHVALNGPGSARDSRTRVVELAATTRRDNLVTFPEFDSLEEVPTHGVTVGLATIADARALRLVLHGSDKRDTAARLLALDRFDPTWPASIVHDHPDAQILVDRTAISDQPNILVVPARALRSSHAR